MMPSLDGSPNVLRRLLYGFAAVVVAAAWTTTAYLVHDARQTTYSEAHQELLGAQYAMRSHAQRTLETAEAFLTSIDAWLESFSRPDTRVPPDSLGLVIARLRRLDPAHPEIRLFDRDGRVLDAAGQATATFADDREMAEALFDTPAGTVHIGLPVLSRTTGNAVMPVALRASPNRFGVTHLELEVELDQFRRTYANLLISAPAVYGILRADSSILFRTPAPRNGLGSRIDGLDLARLRAERGPIGVVEHNRFGGRPGRRLSSFAFLDDYPAMTYASFLRADVEARWRGTAVAAAAFALFVTLATGLLTAAALHLLSRYAAEAERVRRALAEAEAASSAKSSFMGRMSHEFRTPLNAILGFSEVIRDGYLGPLPPAYRDYGADIQRSGRHLLALVDQVLDIAGIQAGTTTLRETAVDLRIVLAEAAEAVAPAAEERRVDIRIHADGPQVRLVADRRMVLQAVLSILSNAVKFSPRGEPVELRVETVAGDVHVVIEDGGPGIPEAVRAYLFEPFGRHHAHIADDRHGLRLGLLIARSFMEIHDGSIVIEPGLGRGTQVTLTFPASRVVAAAP